MMTIPMVRKQKTGLLRDMVRNKGSYVLLLPALAYVIVFSYCTYPYMLLAFKKFNFQLGLWGSEWVGFDNFIFFFKSKAALNVLRNTLWINVLFIFFVTVSAVILALLLNEVRNKIFLKINQAVMLMPHYLSWIVISFMLMGIFSTNFGLLNNILVSLGIERKNWYMDPSIWVSILVGMRVWKGAGINAVIFLAAITGIDEALYESAVLDGANRCQQAFYITLPLIAPTVAILTLLSIGRIMYGDFGMIYAIVSDNGVLYDKTDVIDTYVFRALRQTGDFSQSTAIGLFQSAAGFVMVAGANWITKRLFPDGALY